MIVISLLMVSGTVGADQKSEELPKLLDQAYELVEDTQITEAVRLYKQALGQFNSAEAAYNLAVIYDHYLNYNRKAITYYNKYMSLAKKPADQARIKAWMQQILHDITRRRPSPSQSSQKVSRAKDLIIKAGDDSPYILKANQALENSQFEQAIKLYKQAIAIDDSTLACYNLALLYDEDLAFHKMAVHYYQRVLAADLSPEKEKMVLKKIDAIKKKLIKGNKSSSFTEKFHLKKYNPAMEISGNG